MSNKNGVVFVIYLIRVLLFEFVLFVVEVI